MGMKPVSMKKALDQAFRELDAAKARVAELEGFLPAQVLNVLDSYRKLESQREQMRWGLQWMLNNLTGIDHEWAKEACNIARQSLNPGPPPLSAEERIGRRPISPAEQLG